MLSHIDTIINADPGQSAIASACHGLDGTGTARCGTVKTTTSFAATCGADIWTSMSYRAQRVPSQRVFPRPCNDGVGPADARARLQTHEDHGARELSHSYPHEFGNKRDMSKVAVMRPRMAAGSPASDL
ncbi:hypothetical protein MTO96_013183 [Rhipicephalus appendiculatus]